MTEARQEFCFAAAGGGRDDMVVGGIRKLTLLDYPGKTAATLFLAGCNLRCPFCHNAPLVLCPEGVEKIDTDSVFAFLKKRRGLLDGVCITGGEPTLDPGLLWLAREIKQLGYLVKVDTNGTRPEVLRGLIDGGCVDYIAMDIKNSSEKYAMTVGVQDFDIRPVEESAALLIERGEGGRFDYEFRTTVVRGLHEAQDFHEIGSWLKGAKRYFLQAFVDSGSLIVPGPGGFGREKMKKFLEIARHYIPEAEIRGI
ncbi:MAG: anaerobic ribonucleoside-triphosphate reductase activating protein [Eubacteriales bacterium]|jgi:pyruvate formate lyase activating enzyme